MIYDLEETDVIEQVLDNLMETVDTFSVVTTDDAVNISMLTGSGPILVKRFIDDDHVEMEVV